MTSWRWIEAPLVFAIHDRQIAEHGGLDGIRDIGGLESALFRPQNLAAYGMPDVADLAAAYAFGVVRSHPFLDGNKRTAWVLARLFLADNGHRLGYATADAIRLMQDLAAGEMDEATGAAWFRARLVGG